MEFQGWTQNDPSISESRDCCWVVAGHVNLPTLLFEQLYLLTESLCLRLPHDILTASPSRRAESRRAVLTCSVIWPVLRSDRPWPTNQGSPALKRYAVMPRGGGTLHSRACLLVQLRHAPRKCVPAFLFLSRPPTLPNHSVRLVAPTRARTHAHRVWEKAGSLALGWIINYWIQY